MMEENSQVIAQQEPNKKTSDNNSRQPTNGAEVGADSQPSKPVEVTLEALLRCGAHYGHKTSRWNPKMLPYIFCEKNGIHIINLDHTYQIWQKARKRIVSLASQGANFIFVGTKQQAKKPIEAAAKRCGQAYVTNRWLGGTLTNFSTIKKSLDRLEKLEKLLVDAEDEESKVRLTKKEKLRVKREIEKLDKSLGGIRNMKRTPDVMFVVDIKTEAIAVAEAKKLGIEIIALVDTNCDPNEVDIAIPCNDDSIKTIGLFSQAVADAILEGREASLRAAEIQKNLSEDEKNSQEDSTGDEVVKQKSDNAEEGEQVTTSAEAAN